MKYTLFIDPAPFLAIHVVQEVKRMAADSVVSIASGSVEIQTDNLSDLTDEASRVNEAHARLQMAKRIARKASKN